LPQILLSLIVDGAGVGIAEQLKGLGDKASGTGPFTDLIGPALGYLGPFLAYSLMILLSMMAAYFGLVHVAVHHARQQTAISAGRALWLGLRTAVPSGLVVFVCMVVLTMIGQVLVAPAVLFAVMGLVIPVILAAEPKGALRALWEALTLRYVRQSGFSAWTVMFVLLTVGAIFYTGIALIGLSAHTILRLDQVLHLERVVWTATFGALPYGPVYLGVTLFEVVLSMALLVVMPALTAALYFTVVGKREIAVV
jgi:hypothetical protein